MAQRLITLCDMCGKDDGTAEGREIVICGASVTPDLCDTHFDELLVAVEPFFTLDAVKVTGRAVPVINERGKKAAEANPSAAKPSGLAAHELRAVRAFAKSQGTELRSSGRIADRWINGWREAGQPTEEELQETG